MSVSGQVQKIIAKDTSAGTMYDVMVNGDTYGAGRFKPDFSEGDEISFDVAYRGKFPNIVTRSIEMVGGAPKKAPPAAPQDQPAPTKQHGSTQDVISRQAASNTAIAWLEVLTLAGAVPVTASAKPAVKEQVYAALLDKYRAEFLAYALGMPVSRTQLPVSEEEDTPGETGEWS